jgi:hypothetical protein
LKKTIIASAILAILIASSLSSLFLTSTLAQLTADSNTVSLWHLDETKADEYREITPDSVGNNHGTLGGSPKPTLVEGKFDKALSFNQASFVYVPVSFLVGYPPSPQPIYIPISPSLDIQKEVKIEAWINLQAFTNASYNNILVKCSRSDPEWQSITRVFGLAVKPGLEQNEVTIPQGALSGFVHTDSGGFNEIVTTEPVISVNQWMHVAFTRTSTGMHLYVDGNEKAVKPVFGVENPAGNIINGTEIYIGHDAEIIVDEVRLSNLDPEKPVVAAQVEIGSNLMIAIAVVAIVFAIAWVLRRLIQMWTIHSKSRE